MKNKPENDGIDHINIYSKSKTELGRLLSNFSYSPIVLENDGSFNSIEGYWYWLLCHHQHRDKLRTAWGPEAKEMGRFLKTADFPIDKLDEFQSKIKVALFKKAENNKRIRILLAQTKLPFCHYYVYKNKSLPVSGTDWILEVWDSIRKYCLELEEIEKSKK